MGRGPVGAPAIIRYVNNSLASVTDVSGIDDSMVLIKTLTASSSANLSFVNGTSDVVLDSTYPIYVFKFINIHPATDGTQFTVNFRDGGSSYDATKTSSSFIAYHLENGTASSLGYDADADLAQGTGVQYLSWNIGNENDENIGGYLHLYNPSNTTFVKHYIASTIHNNNNSYANNTYIAGYCNVTAAIDGVQFKMSSGNIDAGTIKLYGIKDS